MFSYALTIFIGAFLLFQVQPLIGKYILPWFGGGPGVWTTCMLFFQMLLLAGYAYAHFISRWFKPRTQAILHLALVVAALTLLPITPGDAWKPRGGGNPTWQILTLLAASLGLPYFILSSTGPLMQQWFSRTHPGASPYRLYALSNFGSLLALVTYPFYFETHFARKTQAGMWGWGLAAYALSSGFCVMKLWKAAQESKVQSPKSKVGEERTQSLNSQLLAAPESDEGGPTLNRFLWLLLPACASVLLLAITNKLCQDVAVIPFLWVAPLGLYLLSFIICFDNPRWYARFPFTLALLASMAGICWALFQGNDVSIYKQVAVYSVGLFVCCMVCHGELYRLRPDPRQLTGYYLMIAAGGALGGLFVAVVAPLIFTDYYELHLGLMLCALLFLIVCARDREADRGWRWLGCALPLAVFGGLDWFLARLAGHSQPIVRGYIIGFRVTVWILVVLLVVSWVVRKRFGGFSHWRFMTCLWLFLGVAGLGTTLWLQTRKSGDESVYTSRNFYGMLTVYEHQRDDPKSHHFLLQHGRITHGLQFVDPEEAAKPTTYYNEESGVGLAARALPAGVRKIGLVGLGAGTLTAYGRAGDELRIYEINPEVERLARSRFTYLSRCPGTVQVVLGDARLSLEKEPPQHFDLLALDAFSSDAIPVHLLTREAFDVYERHLNPDGILAVHISNHYLDLEPVVVNLARQFNYKLALIDYDETDEEWWDYSSTWMLLTRSGTIINSPAIHNAASTVKTNQAKIPLWTDDFTSLFQILK